MWKRAIAGLLWFFSIWAAYEVIWSVAAVPRPIGPVLGLLSAGIVVVDPTGRFWGRRMTGGWRRWLGVRWTPNVKVRGGRSL
jgi:hypothetical protein